MIRVVKGYWYDFAIKVAGLPSRGDLGLLLVDAVVVTGKLGLAVEPEGVCVVI